MKIFYRYIGKIDYSIHTRVQAELKLLEYVSIKETPKGHWIQHKSEFSKKRWISNTSKKRFAYPTKEEALVGLIERTKWRVIHAKREFKLSKSILKQAKKYEIK